MDSTRTDASVFNESGKGYWMEGCGCLRAEGENRPSRPNHVVVILNPWDSQGVQIADGEGIYPCVRGCGGGGYQQGYVLQHLYGEDAVKNEPVREMRKEGQLSGILQTESGLYPAHAAVEPEDQKRKEKE